MIKRLINCFLITIMLSACSKKREDVMLSNQNLYAESDDPIYADVVNYQHGNIVTAAEPGVDRFEPFNRAVFKFNEKLDFLLVKPVATIYTQVLPKTGRQMITDFLDNLCAPLRIIYGIITLDAKATSIAFSRFMINTIFGTLGIADPASRYPELQYKPLDGKSIFKRYGGPAGDYLVLPILGPSSNRGAFGSLIDFLFDPVSWKLNNSLNLARWSLDNMNKRANLLDISNEIKSISMDEYAMTRSLYMQNNP